MQEFENQLTALRESGFLDKMYKAGLISHTPIFYLDIYNKYTNSNYTMRQVARMFNTSVFTVQRACKTMKELYNTDRS